MAALKIPPHRWPLWEEWSWPARLFLNFSSLWFSVFQFLIFWFSISDFLIPNFSLFFADEIVGGLLCSFELWKGGKIFSCQALTFDCTAVAQRTRVSGINVDYTHTLWRRDSCKYFIISKFLRVALFYSLKYCYPTPRGWKVVLWLHYTLAFSGRSREIIGNCVF